MACVSEAESEPFCCAFTKGWLRPVRKNRKAGRNLMNRNIREAGIAGLRCGGSGRKLGRSTNRQAD
jgi:hypothetical protein